MAINVRQDFLDDFCATAAESLLKHVLLRAEGRGALKRLRCSSPCADLVRNESSCFEGKVLQESSTLEENDSSDRKPLLGQQAVKTGGEVAGNEKSSPRAGLEECYGAKKDGRTRVWKQEGVERPRNVCGEDDGELMLNDNDAESAPQHNALAAERIDRREGGLNDNDVMKGGDDEGGGQARQIAVHHELGKEKSLVKRAAFNQATHEATAQISTPTNGEGDDPQESSSSSTITPSSTGSAGSAILLSTPGTPTSASALPAKVSSKPPSPCHVGGISSIPVASVEGSEIGDSGGETLRRQALPVSARR